MPDEVMRIIGGRYQLEELVHRGKSEVYRGQDVRIFRRVAIKLLRADLADDPTFQARFRREAQSSASLNHPAIVAVYDTGEEMAADGVAQPYIVMEYVAGRTLRDILREGRKILPERGLEITSGVLSALDYSHSAGIIHRDIKPGNVMLTPAGDIKVMDFGIARAISNASTTMTQTAAVFGTAQYLSPEQARGETVDPRSDVYSTGCLLYELLTGRPPFVGDSPVSVAYQHVREPAVPPSTYDSDLSPEIDSIVMKALAKRAEDRYQSAAAMRTDIERYLAGRPVDAPSVPTGAAPDGLSGDNNDGLAGGPEQRRQARPVRIRETTGPVDSTDQVMDEDLIGRGPLIDHIGEVITRLTSRAVAKAPATMVVSVDAPWGAGKTMLVHLATSEMRQLKPVIVHYDAWRESRIGPEWWTLGAHIYRAIRRERSLPARAVMVLTTAFARMGRSTTLVSTIVLVSITAAVFLLPISTTTVDGLKTAVTAVLATLAGAVALSRLLFWSSPSLGALYQRTEDAPLDDISVTIARMRRWVPRHTHQSTADNLLFICLAVALLYATVSQLASERPDPPPWAVLAIPAIALCVSAWWMFRFRRTILEWVGSVPTRLVAKGKQLALPLLCVALLGAVLAATDTGDELVHLVTPTVRDGWALMNHSYVALAATIAVGGAGLYLAFIVAAFKYPRRPVIVLLDDLDRCAAEKTVAYLETVHTMLRVDARPKRFANWRAPAPLVVMVIADTRWIRDAFASSFDVFEARSSLHAAGIGDRFIQKLFDHRVLVPDLSPEQSREYVRQLTGSDVSSHPAEEDQQSGDEATTTEDASALVANAQPLDYPHLEAVARSADSPLGVAVVDAIVAQRSTEEYEELLTMHLMNKYSEFMPTNPRSIKRVANAWDMLQALQLGIGESQDEPDLVAAAILMIEFPGLLDDLRSGSFVADEGAWSHPGVLRVRSLRHGHTTSIPTLARCFGWSVPEAPAPAVHAAREAGHPTELADGNEEPPGRTDRVNNTANGRTTGRWLRRRHHSG